MFWWEIFRGNLLGNFPRCASLYIHMTNYTENKLVKLYNLSKNIHNSNTFKLLYYANLSNKSMSHVGTRVKS